MKLSVYTLLIILLGGYIFHLHFEISSLRNEKIHLEIELIYSEAKLYISEQKLEEANKELSLMRPLLNAIGYHESRLNPNIKDGANSDKGMYQITPIGVKEYNIQYKDSLKHEDMSCVEKAEKVVKGLLVVGVKKFLRENTDFPTISDIGRMHNGGIYSGWKKECTEKYGIKIEKSWEKFVLEEINS